MLNVRHDFLCHSVESACANILVMNGISENPGYVLYVNIWFHSAGTPIEIRMLLQVKLLSRFLNILCWYRTS